MHFPYAPYAGMIQIRLMGRRNTCLSARQFGLPLSDFSIAGLRKKVKQENAHQTTTRLEGARYISSDFFTPKVSYHSGKFRGGILQRR